MGYGLGYVQYIPGAPPVSQYIGTELSISDIRTTLISTGIGYLADKGEEALSDANQNILLNHPTSQNTNSNKIRAK